MTHTKERVIWKFILITSGGQEELLPDEVYSLSKGGVWIEKESDEKLKLIFYTEDPEALREVVEEKVEFLKYEIKEEAEKDYSAITKRSFSPVRIGDIRVIAPWSRRYKGKSYIVIQPGMAFGTGRHETTKIMMLLMKEVDLDQKKVVDLGCGSGILSIYASILGAKEVLGIDRDEDAYVSAKKNVILNNARCVDIQKKDISEVEGEFDIVLANLEMSVFKSHMDRIKGLAGSHGRIILSGILRTEKKDIIPFLSDLRIETEKRLGEWVGFVLEKP